MAVASCSDADNHDRVGHDVEGGPLRAANELSLAVGSSPYHR
ncbi:hypothetical protein FHR32_002544 [Streptosporangium album]|uniref:Uncharacterized protein n=1 Tax=Streptosporangium album TaxID=47479 RepID=A0A7W7RU35_9ACTN|nr:hypothetical protein [Streptosporangium album]